MSEFARHIGGRMRQRRKEMGLLIPDVAAEANTSVGQISSAERGLRGISFERLYRIAKVLECSADWFVEGFDGRRGKHEITHE